MDSKIKRIYVPMTETGFYILFCLQKPQHGYGIGQMVKEMTDGEVSISPGTMYGTLAKMEKDGLIVFCHEENKRKLYRITELGREVLDTEIRRIERLYRNSREGLYERYEDNAPLLHNCRFQGRRNLAPGGAPQRLETHKNEAALFFQIRKM